MEYNIRTWNMNYWKERHGNSPKSLNEKMQWIKYAKEMIINDEIFNIIILQETSLNMFAGESIIFQDIDKENITKIEHKNNEYYYHVNPYKYPDWGLMIKTKQVSVKSFCFQNALAYMAYEYNLNGKKIIIFNVHIQKDYRTDTYNPSLLEFINAIDLIYSKNKEVPILLVGDFNASSNFKSTELEVFRKSFDLLYNNFVDCTEKINLENRSTMIDYDYQNDYVFINKKYYKNIINLNINHYINKNNVDHYPIDFKIEL